VRLTPGPAKIHKLGHFGYTTDHYQDTCAWYTDRFNFTPTDILYAPEDASVDVVAFFRLDLGKKYVDHHCFLVANGESPGTKVHHSSFEVEDLDTQFMGHKWLEAKAHQLVWGIGRHVHGSQVFDYWYDPSGFIIEHYADGDVVNEDTELTRAAAGNMAVWGPPVPAIWGGSH
jgi:catechol 2,3-dioxygenase-like lactoylglutathione lyase family enzyme